MINANELRIGNKISHRTVIKSVIAIAKDDIIVAGFGGSGECFEPIPLTTEILKKIGFSEKWDDGYYEYQYKNIVLDLTDGGLMTQCHYEIVLTNLHQLQNLYFALTDEEIETNDL